MAIASRSKRCLATGSAETFAGRILIATSRPSLVSFARYTSPIPPTPSEGTISYGPSLVPEMRAILARHYILKRGTLQLSQRSRRSSERLQDAADLKLGEAIVAGIEARERSELIGSPPLD